MARISKADSELVRVAILQAATEEIADHGYQGLRIPAVAQRVGKTHGAVYGRFPNKEDLALATIRHLRDEIVLPRIMLAVSESTSVVESVEGLSSALAQIADEYPKGQLMFARLASELAGESHVVAVEIRNLHETFARVLIGLFETAQANGELHPDLHPETLGYAVLGLPIAFATMSVMFPKSAGYSDLEKTLSAVLTRGVFVTP